MREEPIIRSPYAYDPVKMLTMSEQEREALYAERVDETAKPYTVIDVITKVFRRDFRADLDIAVLTDESILRSLKKSDSDWEIVNYTVDGMKLLHPESVFGQPVEDFLVDIAFDARLIVHEAHTYMVGMKNTYTVRTEFRLRYTFNLSPCELTCRFVGAIMGRGNGIYNMYPEAIRLNKYLLPVLTSTDDYEKLSRKIIKEDMPRFLDSPNVFSAIDWICDMGLQVYVGSFPEHGVLGEYFFGFGKADIYDYEEDKTERVNVNPGTVVLNLKGCNNRGIINSTAAHEGTHHRTGYYFFMLQMMSGDIYGSFLCKRNYEQKELERSEKWSPIDILELQANKLPGFLLIQEKPGKTRAEYLLESYGGEHSLENMNRLIADMASYFGTTKTIARSRLYDFGYTAVRGISRYINGQRIPSYISDLSNNETYTVDEKDSIAEYISNEKFRRLIDTRAYEYLEGHYCLRDDRYIAVDHEGKRHLTPYARQHMNECCLVFGIRYENSAVTRFVNGILRKGEAPKKKIVYTDRNGGTLVTAEGIAKRRELANQLEERRLIQKSFNEMTVELMKSRGFTIDRLAEETGLSVETIKNMRNDPTNVCRIEAVTAVCIALHLPEEISRIYINRSPAKFTDTVDMAVYQYALSQWKDLSVAKVNRKLLEYGAKPLTDNISGYGEDIFKQQAN